MKTTTNMVKTLPQQFARFYRQKTNGNSMRERQLIEDLGAFITYIHVCEAYAKEDGFNERYSWRSIANYKGKDAQGRNAIISAWITYQRETIKDTANTIARRLQTLKSFYLWLHWQHPNEIPMATVA